jgi:uncharacterized protein (TIGR00251 family)
VIGQLRIQVHPGARRSSVRGWRQDGALKLEVVSPPEDGRANQAVTRLLAEVLGVQRRQVSVVRGLGSRTKWIEVEGLSEAEIRHRIEEALGADHGQ